MLGAQAEHSLVYPLQPCGGHCQLQWSLDRGKPPSEPGMLHRLVVQSGPCACTMVSGKLCSP